MTTQEAYEQIRHWFAVEAIAFGYDHDARECVYRGGHEVDSPIRCAVGCLIPDELYTGEMESHWVESVFREWPSVGDHFDGVDTGFLSDAQRDHDEMARQGASTLDDFVEQLDKVAERYGLEVVS